MLLERRLTSFRTSALTHFEGWQLLLLLHSWSAGAEFHVIHPRVGDLALAISKGSTWPRRL